MSEKDRKRLKEIQTFPALVKYLREDLGWPVEQDDFDESTFDWEADELGIDPDQAAKIEYIKQLRPLENGQPQGVFFVKFDTRKLPVVALRRLLSKLVVKKRASADAAERPLWEMRNLVFISSYGERDERQLSFAYFQDSEQKVELPTLKVLGWDDRDTALHLDRVHDQLAAYLRWPESPTALQAWRKGWSRAFELRHGQVVSTAKELSEQLAALARGIRERASQLLKLENQTGPLRTLMAGFKKALIHDLTEDQFADMYAQTIAYGLLSARIANPKAKTADDLAAHMRTNPFLRELMDQFLKAGGRQGKAGGRGIDFDELGVSEVVEMLDQTDMDAVVRDFGDQNPYEDPVIHFYERFLESYDKQQKIRRGVFYTPRPIVTCIVRSVDALLRADFGLADGLADTSTWAEVASRNSNLTIPRTVRPDSAFVHVLDPAVGTGTFLVEVIEIIHKTMVSKWTLQGHSPEEIKDLWNAYVPRDLLPRVCGYELLMAPYAIAHLKIGLKLYETGYRFGSEERAQIYLTDSLEPATDDARQLTLEALAPALAHEAMAVNAVKRDRPFTVVIGNPPYLREKERGPGDRSERIGGWLRFGDVTSAKAPLFNDFVEPLAKTGRSVHAKLVYELSVMFWRLALWLVYERSARVGIVAMISPRAYLAGPGHFGMRSVMRKVANNIWVFDLGGDNRGALKSENVFNIETGVAIGVCERSPGHIGAACHVDYKDIQGSADDKLKALENTDVPTCSGWRSCASNSDAFVPEAGGDYATWPPITDLLPWQHSGCQFKRLWPIAESRNVLEERWKLLVSMPKNRRAAAFIETDARLVGRKVGGPPALRFTGILDAPTSAPLPRIERYCYRTLDRQWAFVDERLADRLRPDLIAVLGERQVFAATLMSKPLGDGPAISVSSALPDMDVFCNRGAKDIIPLWKDAAGTVPNVAQDALAAINKHLKCAFSPEQFFCYCVAIMGSPSFSNRFRDYLVLPPPRIPVTKDRELFEIGARLGAELIWLQTYGERWLSTGSPPRRRLTGTAAVAKKISDSPEKYPEEFSYDEDKRTLLIGNGMVSDVAPIVYDYGVSGFKVVRSWLRYRMKERGGRARSASTRSELDEIRPSGWTFTQELLELLWVIEGCIGMWPALDEFLGEVVAGEVLTATSLPVPRAVERVPLKIDSDGSQGRLV